VREQLERAFGTVETVPAEQCENLAGGAP
jgi:hypothetical protein